jgi:hypothetical protein
MIELFVRKQMRFPMRIWFSKAMRISQDEHCFIYRYRSHHAHLHLILSLRLSIDLAIPMEFVSGDILVHA